MRYWPNDAERRVEVLPGMEALFAVGIDDSLGGLRSNLTHADRGRKKKRPEALSLSRLDQPRTLPEACPE
jgi:hypothetical protein